MITQPINTTKCLGEIAEFICVLDIQNVSMDMRRNYVPKWYRTRIDNSRAMNVSIPQHGHRRFSITRTIKNNRLTSVLSITNVTLFHMGPYWLKKNNEDISNMAFLIINTSNGKYILM